MPRTASTAVAEKAMLGPWPLGDCRPSSWMISAVCRCAVGANDRISPLRWGWCDAGPDSAPPADDPVFPSITIGGQAISGADLLAVQLGERVDEVVEQGGLRMLPAVPGRVAGAITQTEVRREVHDGGRQRLELVDLLAGLAVRQRHEQDIDRLQRFSRLELQLGPPPQVRVNGVHELSPQALGCDLRHFDLRMGKEETKQLSAGVTGPPDDRGF